MEGKKDYLIFLGLLIVSVGLFSVFVLKKEFFEGKKEEILNQEQKECFITEEKIVQGDSMSPLLYSGRKIKIFFNYYDCHKIERNDIVVYNFSGSLNPIVKIIKGLPGDQFKLEKSGSGWQILINNEVLKNSEGKNYFLDETGYRMLSLYEKDYKGQIPDNAFLILGNIISGSLDSSHFGLISKENVLGKVDF